MSNTDSVYFTSDTHLGHEKIIAHSKRPFASVEEMDEVLIENWNKRVKPNDTVYHVGDFSFRAAKDPSLYFRALNGKKFLIHGNHDDAKIKRLPWAGCYPELITKVHGLHFHMYHYPILEWHGFHRNSYHVYGHVHNVFEGPDGKFEIPGRAINVGADVNNFAPVALNIIVNRLELIDNYDDRERVLGKKFRPKNIPSSGDAPWKEE